MSVKDETTKKIRSVDSSPMMSTNEAIRPGGFTANLPKDFLQPADRIAIRLFHEYGAVFVARGETVVPGFVVFKDSAAVSAFQANVHSTANSVGGITIELQEPAMSALNEASSGACRSGITITPRGSDAAKRSYDDTVKLWTSRVNPGLAHWAAARRISADEAARIKGLTPCEQVPEIFRLEEKGLYFSKDLSKSILYSVAPPGASQHLSMLALDITEHEDQKVRDILTLHGWFQTVISDMPHFTFLGVAQDDLPKLGLKGVSRGDRTFWVPDV